MVDVTWDKVAYHQWPSPKNFCAVLKIFVRWYFWSTMHNDALDVHRWFKLAVTLSSEVTRCDTMEPIMAHRTLMKWPLDRSQCAVLLSLQFTTLQSRTQISSTDVTESCWHQRVSSVNCRSMPMVVNNCAKLSKHWGCLFINAVIWHLAQCERWCDTTRGLERHNCRKADKLLCRQWKIILCCVDKSYNVLW